MSKINNKEYKKCKEVTWSVKCNEYSVYKRGTIGTFELITFWSAVWVYDTSLTQASTNGDSVLRQVVEQLPKKMNEKLTA